MALVHWLIYIHRQIVPSKKKKKNRINERCDYQTYVAVVLTIFFFILLSIVPLQHMASKVFIEEQIKQNGYPFDEFFEVTPTHGQEFFWGCEMEKILERRHEFELFNRDWFRAITMKFTKRNPLSLQKYHSLLNLLDELKNKQ